MKEKSTGNMKVRIAVATWFIYWTAAFGSPGDFPLIEGYASLTLTADLYLNHYLAFIDDLRRALKSEDVSHGIPVLPRQVSVNSSNRFVLVELEHPVEDMTSIIALDVTNANVVGFTSDNQQSFFFNDVYDDIYNSPLFEDTNKHRLKYGGSYKSLEDQGAKRDNVLLGIRPLRAAILQLANYSNTEADIAPSLLIVIQMVSEAARLQILLDKFKDYAHFHIGLLPKANIISFEDNWKVLSYSIQSSGCGCFSPVTLMDDDNKPYEVCTVTEVKERMGLLLGEVFGSSLGRIIEFREKFLAE